MGIANRLRQFVGMNVFVEKADCASLGGTRHEIAFAKAGQRDDLNFWLCCFDRVSGG